MHKASYYQSSIYGIDVIEICSDRTFPRHTHDEFGVGYILQGGQESWSGRGLVEARANNIITVNPGEVHDGIGYPGKARHWMMLFVKPDAMAALTEFSPDSLAFHNPVLDNRDLKNTVQCAFEALSQPVPDIDECEQCLMLMCSELLQEPLQPQKKRNSRPSKSVRLLLEHLNDAWCSSLSLEDLAASVQLSRYQTLRHFRNETGMTPHAFLTQYRLKQAKKHLEQGESLVDTALSCGFADQSHMTRAFKRQFGVSPGKISRQHQSVK